jgi:hypothetical protein
LVEHDLAKVGVAGSSPVFRSKPVPDPGAVFFSPDYSGRLPALVVELVDTQDLKSCSPQRECGFNSRLGHEKAGQLLISFFYWVIAYKDTNNHSPFSL